MRTIRLLSFAKRLNLCNHRQTGGTILQWLDMALRLVHILPIFHNESYTREAFLPTKNLMSPVILRWSKFSDGAPFLSRTKHKRLSLFE